MIKGIEKIPLSGNARKLLEQSEVNYKRYARIWFQVVSYENKELVVKVWQTDNTAGKYLSAPELINRARDVHTGLCFIISSSR